jgi:HEAT repeat protein
MMEELVAVGAIEATNVVAAMDRKLRLQAAFEVLGPVAKPLVPELIAELKAGRSLGNAAHALAQIGGDEAQRALIEAVTNADPRIRAAGAASVRYLRHNPEKSREAVPPLLVVLGDSSAVLRSVAADSLGILKAEPQHVIPALVQTAETDPHSVIRAVAIKSIQHFGTVPSDIQRRLQKIADTDADEHVRKMATRAVEVLKLSR